MHVMRRLKSFASGRSSVSDPLAKQANDQCAPYRLRLGSLSTWKGRLQFAFWSIPRDGGDAGTKRAKLEQEGGAENSGASASIAGTSEASEQQMASVSVEPSIAGNVGSSSMAEFPKTGNSGVDQLPKEMHEMKIRDDKSDSVDDKVSGCALGIFNAAKEGIYSARIAFNHQAEIEAAVVNGNGTETGHIIATTIGGRNGQPKQTISYMAERVVGTGSFGIVFQAKCLETGEPVAIKKVLQDKRYKNRELQIMRMLDHPNIVQLKHCFFSTTDKDELYLNLVLEYVPETVYRIAKHYNRMNQRMPLIYVKLYTYQICRSLAYIHGAIGVCHRDIKPQNLLVNPHTHQLKLCDFGSAKMLVKGEPNISYICSRYYRAPELIFGATEYTTAIDIWSLGCVLAELLLAQVYFYCHFVDTAESKGKKELLGVGYFHVLKSLAAPEFQLVNMTFCIGQVTKLWLLPNVG
eukprot:Gb_28804 [translate_table: standard]